jgi:hypothetical protein
MISGCRDEQTSADVSNVANFQLPDPAGSCEEWCYSTLIYFEMFIHYSSLYYLKPISFVTPGRAGGACTSAMYVPENILLLLFVSICFLILCCFFLPQTQSSICGS